MIFKLEGKTEFSKDGKFFVKEVARSGVHTDGNGNEIELTMEMFDEICNKFMASAVAVPIPLGHSGIYDPLKNTGFVRGLWTLGQSLMAKMEITEPLVSEKIENGTIVDDSISIFKNDTGWNIEHIALTLLPAITGLGKFQPVELEKAEKTIVWTFERETKILQKGDKKMEENQKIELEKTIASKIELENALAIEKANFEKLKVDSSTTIDNLKVELETANKSLCAFETEKNGMVIDKFVAEGKLLPTQVEMAKKLYSTDKASFEAFISLITPIKLESVVTEVAKPIEKRMITKMELKGMTKEQYLVFAKELKEGKATIV